MLHWPKCHHITFSRASEDLTVSGSGEDGTRLSVCMALAGSHGFSRAGRFPVCWDSGELTGSCIRTCRTRNSRVRWRQVGQAGEWKQGNVDFSCDSDRPPATVQGIVRDGGRPFPRLCWEILFQRQQSQKMACESSVLSASPAIGGLLLYSVYDSATSTFPFKKISDSFTC